MGKGLNEIWLPRKKELKQNIYCSEYNQNDPQDRKPWSYIGKSTHDWWEEDSFYY